MNKSIFIVGPTCAGKNDYAYELSKNFDIEIINADSIQVYKQLRILSLASELWVQSTSHSFFAATMGWSSRLAPTQNSFAAMV